MAAPSSDRDKLKAVMARQWSNSSCSTSSTATTKSIGDRVAAFQQAASEFEDWFVEELFLFYQHGIHKGQRQVAGLPDFDINFWLDKFERLPGTRGYKKMDEAAVCVHVFTLQREIQLQGFDPLPAEVAAEFARRFVKLRDTYCDFGLTGSSSIHSWSSYDGLSGGGVSMDGGATKSCPSYSKLLLGKATPQQTPQKANWAVWDTQSKASAN
eukprot:CAMPEP_0180311898 /NCGR_PEP_ID=MMETSP0988-20121125/30521_1 /TAXON_ID=697907 /ORGANISM="non described non described, Strain CCMP2293" /LENGTH=211 /DNA_ID=CAMNT_0022296061 /DNA_START=21 /DNA_END=656 /DNA_ORIENTATION=+